MTQTRTEPKTICLPPVGGGRHNSLSNIGPKLWNELDNDLNLSDSVHSFKQKISQWMGPKLSFVYLSWCELHWNYGMFTMFTMVNILVALFSSNRYDILDIVTRSLL